MKASICSLAVSSSIALGVGLAFPTASFAQAATRQPSADEPSGGIADIIVTAEKRETSLQRTPVAVTALGAEALAERQVTDIRDISYLVPNLRTGENAGYSQIYLRGIGITNFTPLAESTVAVNLNEVYISRTTSFYTGMYDVSSVEVLRGPQGTLYGRNATAGSINIQTNRPTDTLSGYVAIDVGNYDLVKAEAAISGPIVEDVLKVRVAGYAKRRNGFGKNLTTGRDIDFENARAIRATVELTPTPDFSATLIGEYYEHNNGGSLKYLGDAGFNGRPGARGAPSFSAQLGNVTTRGWDKYSDMTEFFDMDSTALTGILNYDLGVFSLKSISGYRKQHALILNDPDGSDSDLSVYYSGEPARQFSQELQINYTGSRLNFTAGLYYFNEKARAEPSIYAQNSNVTDLAIPVFGPRPDFIINFANLGGRIKTISKAAFAQASYEVVSDLKLIGGLRYSKDRKTVVSRYNISLVDPYSPNAPLPPELTPVSKSWDSVTPKIGVQFQASPKTLVYATFSKGFKAGGFDVGANPGPTGVEVDTSFDPEELTSYEVGLKTTMLENTLRANLVGYYYDYQDLQVTQPGNLSVLTENAATAEIYGVEAELTYLPIDDLELNLSVNWIKSKYKDYTAPDPARPLLVGLADFSGNHLSNTPEWSGVAGAKYSIPMANGKLVLRGEMQYSTKYYLTPGNYDGFGGQKGFVKGNLSASYQFDDGFDITAYVRNVGNVRTKDTVLISNAFIGTPVQGTYAPPRTYGLQIAYRY